MADNIKALRENAEQEEMDITDVPEGVTEQDADEKNAAAIRDAVDKMEWMITEDGDRLTVMTIKKRKIPLRFVLSDVKDMEAEVGKITEVEQLLKDDFMSAGHVARVIHTIRILGNSGLRAMQKEPDLTNEWIGDRLRPTDINLPMILQLLVTLWGGMGMETEDAEENDKEHDVVLEDLRKKKAAGN